MALTIDSDTMPYKALLIRGTVQTDIIDGIAPEYGAMTVRVTGEEQARIWLENMRPICPRMSRVFITPARVRILDLRTRVASAEERAMELAQRQALCEYDSGPRGQEPRR